MVSHPEAFAFFPPPSLSARLPPSRAPPLSSLPHRTDVTDAFPSLSRNFLLHESKTISRFLVSGNLSGKGGGLGLGLRSWERSPDWRRVAMVPPPPPLVEGEQQLTVADGQKSMPTPFLTKTYQLVDDPAIDNVISWNEDGTTFIVWRPIEFAGDLLPKYFKHNNFSSFLRQLSTYGFRKIMSNRWEFTNECFRRGEKRLLCDIRRRKITPGPPVQAAISVAVLANRGGSLADSADEQILSSNSSPGRGGQRLPVAMGRAAPSGCSGSAELIEENERLRRENMQLSHELGLMKNLYSNILLLKSKYASNQQQGGATTDAPCGGDDGLSLVVVATPLELMPARWSQEEEEEEAKGAVRMKVEEGRGPSLRLFGVPIGLKRSWHDDAKEPQATVVPGCEI